VSWLDEVRVQARKYALLNAVKHNGKAEASSVVGKIYAEKAELKQFMRDVAEAVSKVVDEVNRLTMDEQRRIIEDSWPELLVEEKVKEKKVLPPLPNVDKYPKVVTRFSPNPDCVLHLGSVRAVVLCYEYREMYRGEFYLRFEDTDPRLKRSNLEFYDLVKEDLVWLGCRWDREFIQSDRVPVYYDHARKLLELGGAYVCTCKPDQFKALILRGKSCGCRELPSTEHVARWEKMLNGTYGEGDAVVRVKTELSHPNPAVRDWPALRIIDADRNPHPRVGAKYRVWPLYNFACGVDDHLMGVTHIIRGKEHYTNMVRQKYMYSHFSWSYPEAIHYGRLSVEGAVLSKSKILQGLKDCLYRDFSDPRLATLIALRRRGITPEALKRLVQEVGVKPVDITVSWDNIYAYNRKIMDPTSNRYFFLESPFPLRVKGIQKTYISKPKLHPDHPERGNRLLEVKPVNGEARLLISKKDKELLKQSQAVRLMELFNIQAEHVDEKTVTAKFLGESHMEARKTGVPLIHWLPESNNVKVEVVMPTAESLEGVGEPDLAKEAAGSIVQLVRFGFGRIDLVEDGKIRIYYAHS